MDVGLGVDVWVGRRVGVEARVAVGLGDRVGVDGIVVGGSDVTSTVLATVASPADDSVPNLEVDVATV